MLPQEIIRRKRDGGRLSEAEIAFLVRGITDGSIGDGQVAAFAMAAFLKGLDRAECVALTREMTDSGERLSWSGFDLPGPVLDKHSTGGVGDKVSLMLAPIVAAAGGFVPMLSGRGLGHTGGTLDKLDSIPGYVSQPDVARFQRVVREAGCAIIGQTNRLAPADKRLYAIRDVTATVESMPLITASILSKKLAAGLDGLVMDVKTGSGAFADTERMARDLADSIVGVAAGAGLRTSALITDMDQPLGHHVGNALEVLEAVAFLTGGRREARLLEVVLALAGEMLALGGLAGTPEAGRAAAARTLADGTAAEAFGRMVAGLGGPADFVERAGHHLPAAPVVRPCPAPAAGLVARFDCRAVGLAVVSLGGGRRRAEDGVDHRVGLADIAHVGDPVGSDRPLALVHAASEDQAEAAIRALQAAVTIGETARAAPIVRARIGPDAAGTAP